MAVLGVGGKIMLKRELASPVQVVPADHHIATNSFAVSDQAFWTGDQVTLSCSRGLTFDDPAVAGTRAACPDGYAVYAGGPWPLGPRASHLQNDTSTFYANNDARIFYNTATDVGQITSATYYIYRDQLDRISFYTTVAGAFRGSTTDRVPMYSADFGLITITGAQDPWAIQGYITNWSLQLTAGEIDTTAVGEKFGDAVKSVVTGGGTMDFIVEREENIRDSTDLMRLLLMTENGCECDAEFWMIDNRAAAGELLPGGLYYSTSILITANAINTRVDEIITGSANFVTVKTVSLKIGTN
jgi:hypothetical protein